MKHTHKFTPDGGCRENPGVFTQGKTMRYQSVCNCGAHKLIITSVQPYDRGEYRQITDPAGRIVSKRDTRNWC